MSIEVRVLKWLKGDNVGRSSMFMAYKALGMEAEYGRPYDPADLNRCFMLIKKVPEVKEHFHEIAATSKKWAALIKNWDELENLFVSEVGENWSKGDSAPKTYNFMNELFSEVEKKEEIK